MPSELENALRLDALLARVATLARPVPSLTPENAVVERARLVRCLEQGETPLPAFSARQHRIESGAYRIIDEARALARQVDVGSVYGDRLDELELDLAILDAWGDAARVRPLS